MDDLELDRTLRNALDVNPSPEFVARVRATIADAPPPSLLAGALKPVAAIACVVVLAIVVGLPREDARLKPSPTESALVTAGLKASTTNAEFGTTNEQTGSANVARRTVVVPTFPPPRTSGGPAVALAKAGRSALAEAGKSAKTAKEPPLPEVIIAPEDIKALQQFVAAGLARRFVASFDEIPSSTAWATNDLTVPPITIEPLDSAPARNN